MWFKVDDKFHENKKTRQLLRMNPAKRRESNAAGLWLLAGCWCMNTEAADGFVPADELDRFDDDWERLADWLVEATLWSHAEHRGEKGYQFHDWETWQPIFELRAKRVEAGRKGGIASAKARAKANAVASAGATVKQTRASAAAKGKQAQPNRQANSTSAQPSPAQPIKMSVADPVSQLQVVRPNGEILTIDEKYVEPLMKATQGPREYLVEAALYALGRPGVTDVRSLGAFLLKCAENEPDQYRYHKRPPKKAEQCPEHAGQWADACAACAIDARLESEHDPEGDE